MLSHSEIQHGVSKLLCISLRNKHSFTRYVIYLVQRYALQLHYVRFHFIADWWFTILFAEESKFLPLVEDFDSTVCTTSTMVNFDRLIRLVEYSNVTAVHFSVDGSQNGKGFRVTRMFFRVLLINLRFYTLLLLYIPRLTPPHRKQGHFWRTLNFWTVVCVTAILHP